MIGLLDLRAMFFCRCGFCGRSCWSWGELLWFALESGVIDMGLFELGPRDLRDLRSESVVFLGPRRVDWGETTLCELCFEGDIEGTGRGARCDDDQLLPSSPKTIEEGSV